MDIYKPEDFWNEDIDEQLYDFCLRVTRRAYDKIERIFERRLDKNKVLGEVRKLLRRYPDCPELAHIAGTFIAEKFNLKTTREFIEGEVERFVKNFKISFDLRMPWSYIGNRPFLRLYYYLGQIYLTLENLDKAREVFENIIWMNPPDNQGARWELAEIYLAQKNYKTLLKLCKIYKDEFSSYLAVNLLLALLKLKKYDEAKKHIEKVIEYHAITLEYIIDGKTEDLGFEPTHFIPSGRSEGYLYFKDFYRFWNKEDIEFIKQYEKKIRDKAKYWRKKLSDETTTLKQLSKYDIHL